MSMPCGVISKGEIHRRVILSAAISFWEILVAGYLRNSMRLAYGIPAFFKRKGLRLKKAGML